jgi:hypothetical protein
MWSQQHLRNRKREYYRTENELARSSKNKNIYESFVGE